MYLERLLQINMATLAALGALLLGMGQRNEGLPLLVAIAAAVSVWLTDITGQFRLSRNVANLLMFLAAVISLRQMFPVTSEADALNFAWFLIFLQIILFFQAKDERKYWLLVILSLLQVVVATLFNQGVWFGFLLATYMLLGFSAMTLLLLYQQWQPQQSKEENQWFRIQDLKSAFHRILNPSPRILSPVVAASAATLVQSGRRWPLAVQQPDFVCLPAGDSRTGIGRDLFIRLGRMALHTTALTLVLFFAVPRFGLDTWRGAVGKTQTLVGYSDKVDLGTLGQVTEDPSEVMQVRLYDRSRNALKSVPGTIYLQGAILMDYQQNRKDGRVEASWQTGRPSWDIRVEFLDRPEKLPQSDFVLQEIKIEGLNQRELFYVAPYVPLKRTSELTFNHTEQRLMRDESFCDRQFGYRLGTTAIVGGIQKPLVPRNWGEVTKEEALRLLEGDGSEGLPNLRRLAQQWITKSGLPESNRVGRARYLEQQLSTQFQYSLAAQDRDPNIDPIEDFVTKNRRGHCEYFATALTLMLRSQGIPARMVVGYKCDEWNAMGGYYQVRQLHAHTWVEAYLRSSQIPADLKHGGNYWSWERGGWLRLDPTPGGAGTEKKSNWFTPVRGAMDWLDSAWSRYVVELDCERQRDAIYGPISQAAQKAYNAVTDPAQWRKIFRAIMAVLRLDQFSGVMAWLMGGVVAILVAALLASIGWLVWGVGGWLRARWTGNHTGRTRRRTAKIEFYRRFETLLARRGIVRSAGQTQREFAAAAGRQLALLTGQPQWIGLPGVIADAFYRVRFGRQPLDNVEAQAVEHAIRELAAIGRPRHPERSEGSPSGLR